MQLRMNFDLKLCVEISNVWLERRIQIPNSIKMILKVKVPKLKQDSDVNNLLSVLNLLQFIAVTF